MPLTTSAIQATIATTLDDDCERTRTGGGGGGGGGGEPVGGCNPERTQQSVSRGDNPEFGGSYSAITFGTRLACSTGIQLTSVRIQTQLWDRTGGGRINALAKAPERTSINAESAQTVDLYDMDYYPAAQHAEVVQLAQLDAGPGRIWQCNDNATLSFLWCSGVGTRYLSAVVGFHSFATGVGQKVRGGCEWPRRGYYTMAEQNGFAVFNYWASQYCTGSVHVTMSVGLFRASGGPAINTWNGQGQVTQGNPLHVGRGSWLGSHVKPGDEVKITITTILVAPGAASWTSQSTPSHFCVGDGTDVLNCTDTFPKFKVPAAP